MRTSRFFVIIALAVLVLGAAEKPDVEKAPPQTPETAKHQGPIEQGLTTPAQQEPAEPTPFERQMLKTLSAIEKYQSIGYEQIRSDRESWWTNNRVQRGLLLVGVLYTIFACAQWWAIRRQVFLERPWMMFRPENPNKGQQDPASAWPLPPMYQGLFNIPWNVINVGRSPAFLTRLVARIELVQRGQVPAPLSSGTAFPNYIISPKTPPDDRFGSNLPLRLSQAQSVDIQNGQLEIWVYGIVEYRGIRTRRHTSRFCCIWSVENGAYSYDPVGPEGWTKYT